MEAERMILNIISCGKLFDDDSWVCGDFLEQEVDKEGRSLGQCHFCEECHKKAEAIIEIVLKLLDEMPVVKILKDGSQVPFKEENAVILTAFKQEFRKRLEGK